MCHHEVKKAEFLWFYEQTLLILSLSKQFPPTIGSFKSYPFDEVD